MKEHIHLKISASDKQELAIKAKELGLSLSGYIRFRLKDREVTLRGLCSITPNIYDIIMPLK